ncbi:MAG: hypothetical protein H6636_09085 [Anaerolineales bacterium]|nr:hypothetical protein [Anaerolineales bacterium]
MEYLIDIQQNHTNPEGLEALYQFSRKEQTDAAFKTALLTCYEETPDNLLYQAWYYRLTQPDAEPEKADRGANWLIAIPLALLTGLIFWLLSDDTYQIRRQIPTLTIIGAPLAALAIIAYLVLSGKRAKLPSIWIGVALVALPVYTILIYPQIESNLQETYLTMAIPHLALLSWIGIGWSVLTRHKDEKSRLAFILKSFEVLVTAGLYAIAGGIFSGVTFGMFSALGVEIPEAIIRLIFAGGVGVISVIAVASVYDPLRDPADQTFGQGVSRLMPILVRLLLPATLLVLVIYVALIPFNFRAPIENRDVLIINNAMLFAIMGLLLGASPLNENDLPEKIRPWIQRGIIAVAVLAILVSLHALTAIVFRTVTGSLTINRTIVIGWNLANLGILISLLTNQLRHETSWVTSLQKSFKLGTVVYLIWGLFVVLGIPLLY